MMDAIATMPQETLHNLIGQFTNDRDRDIEAFLREKAVSSELRGLASTYMIVSSDDWTGELRIEAYFTLLHKSFEILPSVSKSARKRIFLGCDNGEKSQHFVLIAQLGKHISSDWESKMTVEEILGNAFDVIHESDEIIACPNVLLECDIDRTGLHKHYHDYGFRELQRDDRFIEFYRRLN